MNRYSKRVKSLELIPSSGGVFEVVADGELIFSKKEVRRFPEPGEVESRLEQDFSR